VCALHSDRGFNKRISYHCLPLPSWLHSELIWFQEILVSSHTMVGGSWSQLFPVLTLMQQNLWLCCWIISIICCCHRLVWCSRSLVYDWVGTAGACRTCRVGVCLLSLRSVQSLGSNSRRVFNTSCRCVRNYLSPSMYLSYLTHITYDHIIEVYIVWRCLQ